MRSSRPWRRGLNPYAPVMALIMGWCALAPAGCTQRTILAETAADKFSTDDAELDFWQQLERQRVLTNDDALHGLLLVANGTDASASYAERVAAAEARGWIGSGARLPARESAQMGMIAVAVCQILDIKGGLSMGLAPRAPRYCTRELVYLRIIPPRSENQSLSGLEFLDLIGRVEARLPRPEENAS